MRVRIAVAVALTGTVAGLAAYGWASGWNAYTNLLLTLGWAVLVITLAIATDGADRDG